MPGIEFSETFLKAYQALTKEKQEKARKCIRLLAEDPRHPSLQTKPVQGAKGIFEARVDQSTRLTYERRPGDILLLRVIGTHDAVLKKP